MGYRKTILLDFDGVLHHYTGWNEGRLNKPLPGARKACLLLARKYRLVCFTTRATNPELMEGVLQWLRQWGFPEMRVTAIKEPSFVQIDDRSIPFTGQWSDEFLQQVDNFRTYWESMQLPPEPQLESEALQQSLAGDLPRGLE